MQANTLNRWDVDPTEATRIQDELKQFVRIEDDFGQINLVAGVDVGFFPSEGMASGGIVIQSFPALEMVETACAKEPVDFPYIPGLLAFRELPVILSAFEMIESDPDLVIVDGQGLAHPRRFGIACHLGLLLDKPTIGCGKSRLIGKYEEPGTMPGDKSPLMVDNEQVGIVLRTKEKVKPVFISPGHKVSIETAPTLILQCCKGYRLPEPTRLAHNLVSGRLPRAVLSGVHR